jgi:transposase-like protein
MGGVRSMAGGKRVGRVPVLVEKRDGAFFRLVKCTTSHKLRTLERTAPRHALAAIRDDFHRIVYAATTDTARLAYAGFERTWAKRCPGVVTSLREGGDELLTFFGFPTIQWKTLRTTSCVGSMDGGRSPPY